MELMTPQVELNRKEQEASTNEAFIKPVICAHKQRPPIGNGVDAVFAVVAL